jgi:hypothetical protein
MQSIKQSFPSAEIPRLVVLLRIWPAIKATFATSRVRK